MWAPITLHQKQSLAENVEKRGHVPALIEPFGPLHYFLLSFPSCWRNNNSSPCLAESWSYLWTLKTQGKRDELLKHSQRAGGALTSFKIVQHFSWGYRRSLVVQCLGLTELHKYCCCLPLLSAFIQLPDFARFPGKEINV